jgi:hypothetical protein
MQAIRVIAQGLASSNSALNIEETDELIADDVLCWIFLLRSILAFASTFHGQFIGQTKRKKSSNPR